MLLGRIFDTHAFQFGIQCKFFAVGKNTHRIFVAQLLQPDTFQYVIDDHGCLFSDSGTCLGSGYLEIIYQFQNRPLVIAIEFDAPHTTDFVHVVADGHIFRVQLFQHR